MNVRPLFVSNPQPPELIPPSESPFDYPAPAPSPLPCSVIADNPELANQRKRFIRSYERRTSTAFDKSEI